MSGMSEIESLHGELAEARRRVRAQANRIAELEAKLLKQDQAYAEFRDHYYQRAMDAEQRCRDFWRLWDSLKDAFRRMEGEDSALELLAELRDTGPPLRGDSEEG